MPSAACKRALRCFDATIKVVEPWLAGLAIALVTLDAYVFFTAIIPRVKQEHGPGAAALHTAAGCWLLFCVLWNHTLCIFTPPGTTQQEDAQALQQAMTFEWRWCRKCNRPKPPLSHHCSVCNKCVLKMDHHCPWMANCIGHYNYHFFFLYLVYMWVGSAYSMCMTYAHVPRLFSASLMAGAFLLPLTFLLAVSVFLAVAGLLGWHVWLVLTGQGTIDAYASYNAAQEARPDGQPWVNWCHLGAARNWRETFDATGRCWWLTWMLPSWRRKRGNGYTLPRASPV